MISQYVIALGSNINSQHAFEIALMELKKLGEILVSSITSSGDFTGKTSLIYHNAVMMMTLDEPLIYDELNALLKDIEIKCGRTDIKHIVPMDLDILAYYDDIWCIVDKRLPFKLHEKRGLSEVAPFLLTA